MADIEQKLTNNPDPEASKDEQQKITEVEPEAD